MACGSCATGLKAGDTIVVNGLQRVRPGALISPERVAMGEHSRHRLEAASWRNPPVLTDSLMSNATTCLRT